MNYIGREWDNHYAVIDKACNGLYFHTFSFSPRSSMELADESFGFNSDDHDVVELIVSVKRVVNAGF